jgi:hypothetical protein
VKLLFIATTIAGLALPMSSWGQRAPAAAKPETKTARYARLDKYARQLPNDGAATVEALAASLGAQARSDDDKARLIFAWLAYHVAYDAALLRADTMQLIYRCAPETVLQTRKTVCQGYAELFTDLATRMKLEAYTVTGYARDWLTAGNMLEQANSHAWNLYRVAGQLHIADATWGAGGISSESKEFEPAFAPFWFDIAPAQAIFSHLPTESSSQLLPAPVTPAAFQSWPYVAPEWFQLTTGPSLLQTFATRPGTLQSLPKIQVTKSAHTVQLVQVPLQGKLQAGQPVRFVLSAPTGVELTIEGDTGAVPLKPSGRYQQATITPRTSPLTLSAWQKADTTFMFSLQYEVVPAPHPPQLYRGRNRAAPLDSVVYLRHQSPRQPTRP